MNKYKIGLQTKTKEKASYNYERKQPRTILGHKQNISPKCNAEKKPDAAGHGREGLSLESGEHGQRALRGVPGGAARLVPVTTAPTGPESRKTRLRMMKRRRDVERRRDGFAHGERR